MVVSNAGILSLMASLAWLFFILVAWEGVWKGIALWRAGRNNHVAWFVCIFVFNTLGILPIIYLLWFQDNKAPKPLKSGNSRRNLSGKKSNTSRSRDSRRR